MADQQSRRRVDSDDTFERFIWKVENFSHHLATNELYSHTTVIEGQPWRILLFPRGHDDYLSIYLNAVNSDKLPSGWTKDVKIKLTVFNQQFKTMNITKENTFKFDEVLNEWGFTYFMPLDEFHDPCKGFLVEDTCMIGAEVSAVSESSLDFMDFGKIEKAFVPLLKEACSKHPSLVACHQKRSRAFTEWAFTALGRVLHFLKTKKVKDMDELACEDLQVLWEELEAFKFDLTWLKPHVNFALRMKNYVEKAAGVKKLKENVVSMKLEMKMIELKLAMAKAELDRASRFFEEEGLYEIDMDVELGYGL